VIVAYRRQDEFDALRRAIDANRVEIAVCSIPALLAMKGHALQNRLKQKDAHDIYYIAEKFDRPDGYGPDRVRRLV